MTQRFRGLEREPMRIALFAPALPGSGVSNGIVTYTGIMRDALRALDHEVIVLGGDYIEHPDGRVRQVPTSNAVARQIRRYIEMRRTEDVSSIWIRLRILDAFRAARRAGAQLFEIEESYGWAGRLAGRGAAIVTRLHGPHGFVRDSVETAEQKQSGDLREASEIASFKKVQAVSFPTRRLLEAITERYALKLPLTRVIPNPVPVLPKGWTWNVEGADAEQILFIGRFDLCKGADLVLQAFARAVEIRPSLKLIMAGPDVGLAQPGGGWVHFDQYAASLAPQVRERVRFLGPLPPDRLADLRRESGFSLIGSRFETFSYVVAEAMAAGMPVLATDSFGPAEIIRDGIDGRIVPVGDVEAMAHAMAELAGDSARLAEMGRSAYARVADWLSPKRIAQETVSLYHEAMRRL